MNQEGNGRVNNSEEIPISKLQILNKFKYSVSRLVSKGSEYKYGVFRI